MPSGEKVNKFLSSVEEHIAEDHQLVEVFAEVLKNQGSYFSVIGNNLERTYHEYFLLYIAFVKSHVKMIFGIHVIYYLVRVLYCLFKIQCESVCKNFIYIH